MAEPRGEAVFREEERAAWEEYRASTRNEVGSRYEEVEPWAWARLNQRLRALEARRRARARKA